MSRGKADPLTRFLRFIRPSASTGCWNWSGGRLRAKNLTYSAFIAEGQTTGHRWAYQYFNGTIPDGLTIDHLCRNTLCVNPSHLEAVELIVNIRRGGNSIKTHCPSGHPYTPENTYNDAGGRKCRICVRARVQRYKRRIRSVAS